MSTRPAVAAVYDLTMSVQDRLGLRKQRLRTTGAATGKVLEVGVGTGWNLPFYSQATEVVGIDPDPSMLRRARRKVGGAPCPVALVEGDAQSLPFEDADFDTVVVSLSLCTIPDPAAALREIRRVLKPEGKLAFLEHVRSPRPGVARWQDRITPLWRRVAGGCHPNRTTVETMRAQGFEVDRLWRSRSGRGVIVQGEARPAPPP